jgi:hypothetical protein
MGLQIALAVSTTLGALMVGLPAWLFLSSLLTSDVLDAGRVVDNAGVTPVFIGLETFFKLISFLLYLSTSISIGLTLSALISQRRLTKLALVGLAFTGFLVLATALVCVRVYSCFNSESCSGIHVL